MGLFSKKEKAFKPIKLLAVLYDGELPGFKNGAVNLLLDADKLTISTKKTTATLDCARIDRAEYFYKEADYMLKYHGHATTSGTPSLSGLNYFVIHYTSKDGDKKRLAFSCEAITGPTAHKIVNALTEAQGGEYEL